MGGHTIEYLDDMDHWTFLEITDGINSSRSEQQPSKSGKTKYKKISKSQRIMQEARIKQREKEGIKHGK
jgi:predicted secreted protein